MQAVFGAVVPCLARWERVACFDIVKIDDFHLEAAWDGVVHYVRTASRNCDEYLFHGCPLMDILQEDACEV